MSAVSLLPPLVLAVVLGVSGAAKVADRQGTADMFVSLKVPWLSRRPRAWAAAALPYAELALAAALLLTRGWLLVASAIAAVALFAAYWLLIARAMRFTPRPTCSCFGRLGGHRVDGFTLTRNTLLLGLAVATLAAASDSRHAWASVRAFDGSDTAWLSGTVVVAALAWLIARGASTPPPMPPVPIGAPAHDQSEQWEEDYLRSPIPYAFVVDPDGNRRTLRELAATQARLLVVLSPACGACARVAERLDGWAAELGELVGVHAVYSDEHVGLTPQHDPSRVLWESDKSVRGVLEMGFTPSAVLLGADGWLAGGPVVGEAEIEELVAEMKVSLSAM